VAEIDNSSLETVGLRLKSLNINDVVGFPFISQPSVEGLKNSVELLQMIGSVDG
jgi:HrpA-like RNA helicase